VGGETFDVIDTGDTQSGVRCGSAFHRISAGGIDPADPIKDDLSLLQFNGSCTVTLVLRENGPVFGGVLKTVTAPLSIGQPTTYQAEASDWNVRWDPAQSTSSQALITYSGSTFTTAQLGQITQNWTATVRGPAGQACGSWSGANPPDGVDVPASGSCVNDYGDQDGWSVDITYEDVSTGNQHSVPGSHQLDGPPPSYQPCAPSDFAAAWGGDATTPTITLTVGGKLSGCGGWAYELHDPDDAVCPTQSSGTPDSVTLTPSCTIPPGDGNQWTLDVTWTDPAGNPQPQPSPQVVPVSGAPPQ